MKKLQQPALVNQSPQIDIDYKTTYEVLGGRAVDYSDPRVFGYTTDYHVNEDKLEPKSNKGVFIGYETCAKGYKIYYDNKIVLSKSVVFDESFMVKY